MLATTQRLTTILLLFIFIACGNKYQNSQQVSLKDKKWLLLESHDGSTPIARHEAAFVNVNNKFYLLGGRGIRAVSIYDTKTGQWTLGKKPPIEFHHFQPVVYGDKVYIIGALTGRYPAETPVDHVYFYNTLNDTWNKSDAIPKDRLRGSTGNIIKDDIIYITCGISNGHIDGHKNWTDSYNVTSGEWEILSDAPRARDHFQAVEANNKIYLLAGRRSKAPDSTFVDTEPKVDVYDIANRSWTTLDNKIPTQRAGNMAIRYQDDILVIGGESIQQTEAHNEVEALNLKTSTWHAYPNLNQGRHGTGVIQYNDALYIASGCGNRGGKPELNTMEKFN